MFLLRRNDRVSASQMNVSRMLVTFVPKHLPTSCADVHRLKNFLISSDGRIVVLTGAGISTESGLPDYRSEGVGLYARSNHKPMTYQEFTRNPISRKRYWARSFVGWPRFSSVVPSRTHEILTHLENRGIISHVVTQNVDNLHRKAGTRRIIELHGTLYQVHCVSCGYTVNRQQFQTMLEELNSKMIQSAGIVKPDGDVDINDEEINSFVVPSCSNCGSYMKPSVTFFGENVPRERSEYVKRIVNECNSLLVLGSSLSIHSAYRIILQAVDAAKPTCIVNIGSTRADHLVTVRINAKCGDILHSTYDLLLKD